MTIHDELEEALAPFKGVDATISFQSGFVANLAVIPALVGAGDVIISDALNHASIVDGVRLSKAAGRSTATPTWRSCASVLPRPARKEPTGSS